MSGATTTVTTTLPGMANPEIEVSVNGLLTSHTGHDGLATITQYDALHRPWKTTDSRNNVTTRAYRTGTSLISSLTDAAAKVTLFDYDVAGRQTKLTDATGQSTYFAYNARGQIVRQWGGGAYPVAYSYHSTFGERVSMQTYRAGSNWSAGSWPESSTGSADTTTWTYDEASGLLWQKADAVGRTTTYDYNVRGQTASRDWARFLPSSGSTRLKTSYSYDGNTGELTFVSYNDAEETLPTAPVSYEYTRLGQVKKVTQAGAQGGIGERTYVYGTSQPWRLSREELGGFYANRILTTKYNEVSGEGGSYGPHTVGSVKGRPAGYRLGISGNEDRDLDLSRTYSNQGRFIGVNMSLEKGAVRDFVYTYHASASLLSGYSMGTGFLFEYAYEATRDLVSRVEGKWNGASVTRFDFTYDDRRQRRTARQSGIAFADYYSGTAYGAVYRYYAYNGRGEVETAAMYRGEPSPGSPSVADELPARRFEYRYDQFGNRLSVGSAGNATQDDAYVPNALNQYVSRENKTVKVLGTAKPQSGVTVLGAGTTGKRDRAFGAELTANNTAGPARGSVTVEATLPGGGASLVRTVTRDYFIPKRTQTFTWDPDGNLLSDGVWQYTYDAENRLVRQQSLLPSGLGFTRLRLDFTYDHLGRRVQKRVYDLETSTETLGRRFIYEGWQLIAETDLSGNLVRSYTWGLDLTGSLEVSGGVGALLQLTNHHGGGATTSYLPTYDGNGNVAALMRQDGVMAAVYEYSPFGETLRATVFDGAVADNPVRFSTRYTDVETGLVYYGFRYYAPALGRFINRDPKGEDGGLNLYGFVGNDPLGRTDRLGLEDSVITLPPVQVDARPLPPTDPSFGLGLLSGQYIRANAGFGVIFTPRDNTSFGRQANDLIDRYRIKDLLTRKSHVKAEVLWVLIADPTSPLAHLILRSFDEHPLAPNSPGFGQQFLDGANITMRNMLGMQSGENAVIAFRNGQYLEALGWEITGIGQAAATLIPFSNVISRTLSAAETTLSSLFTRAGAAENAGAKLFHYTSERNVAGILENGLRPGAGGKVFTTPAGNLTPMQAQIELALSPNRGLPGAVFEIDTAALRQLGINPSGGPMRVLPTTNAAGVGVEVIFNTQIPPSALRLVPGGPP